MPLLTRLLVIAVLALFALSTAAADPARRAHRAVAKHKRSDASTGQCQPRPSSSSPTPTPTPTSTPAPTPTSTTSPTSSAAPSPNSASAKGCLAWGADPTYLPNFAQLPEVQYLYTWRPDFPSGLEQYGIKPMPMLWGFDQVDAFTSLVKQGYATIALGPNEPNIPTQSNMSPQDAFGLWMQYLAPLKAIGYTLGSPAVTDDDTGITWLQQFFGLFTNNEDASPDFLTIHLYNTDTSYIINYLTNLHNTYNIPVFITEMADQNYSGSGPQASMDQIWDFAGTMSSFIKDTWWVMGACPFGVMTDLQGVNTLNALMTPDGYPTDLAKYYYANF